MTILQNILHPMQEICDCSEMYYHTVLDGQRTNIVYDGYFNIFNMEKWRRYTSLESIGLYLKAHGSGKVQLFSEQGLVTEQSVTAEASVEFSLEKERCYWFSWSPDAEERTELEGYYYTDKDPVNDIHLAADICTFRREKFVERNIRQLETSVLNNKESQLNGKLDVYIIDNGSTLDANEYDLPGVHLLQNMNAGGSGGFTRGIIEINRDSKKHGYTHVVMLDDDVVLEPDALVRTWALLSYMKEDYSQSCVAGTMMDLVKRYMQNERGAKYHNGVTETIGFHKDLRTREAVIENEFLDVEESSYAGWWYACFPLTVAREDNLPLPLFVHYDDMEYGLRNQNGIIYLGGICVWHEGFDQRHSQAQTYYGIRNRLITNALHTDVARKEEQRICFERITYDLLRYQYETADLCLKAVRDFCRGAKSFSKLDPVKVNDDVRMMAGKFVPVEQLSSDENVLEQIRQYIRNASEGTLPESDVSKKAYARTLNGWLLPSKKKQSKVACYSIFQPDMREMYRQKEAVLIDPYHGTGMWVKKSYSRFFHSLWAYLKLTVLLKVCYKKAAASYRKSFKTLTGDRFWQRYLKGQV